MIFADVSPLEAAHLTEIVTGQNGCVLTEIVTEQDPGRLIAFYVVESGELSLDDEDAFTRAEFMQWVKTDTRRRAVWRSLRDTFDMTDDVLYATGCASQWFEATP